MQCKACATSINKQSKWKIFSEDYEGVVPSEEENLCGACLLSARMSFNSSLNHSFKHQLAECRRYFYKEFAHNEYYMPLELFNDLDYASIQIEEM